MTAITLDLDHILIHCVPAVIAAIVILALGHANAGPVLTFFVLCHRLLPLFHQILPQVTISK